MLVKNYQSTTQLASFLVVLRRDYDALKASKAAIKKEKEKLSQEITYLKRKVSPSVSSEESWLTWSLVSRFRVKGRSSSRLVPRSPCWRPTYRLRRKREMGSLERLRCLKELSSRQVQRLLCGGS